VTPEEWKQQENARIFGNIFLFVWCIAYFVWLVLKGFIILVYDSAVASYRKYVLLHKPPIPPPPLYKVRIPIPKYTRRAVLSRAGGFCEECGRRVRHPDVHHINHDPSDNSVENLIVVCGDCHKDIHHEKGYK
jgi:hypothetical protein